ncbi:MAG: tetratricopeptide repeat protein [Reyranella sp.]|nr:tetratricopeptide repeat protein [Reyranella sp.]
MKNWRAPTHYVSDSPSVSLFIRGHALARSGFRPLAAELFREAYASDPTLTDALEDHGALLDVMGQTEGAAAKYDAARRVRMTSRAGPPDRHFVFRHRGSVISEILAYDAALFSIRKNALPYIARGNAYLSIGRPQRALADYEKALKFKRKSPEIMVLKGEALSMLGRYQEALRQFNAALAAQPADVDALGGRAIVRAAIGAVEDANADWRRQLQIQKGPAAARACIALRMADYSLALPALEQALSLETSDPYWPLYRLTARRRLGIPVAANEVPVVRDWPGPLLDLHAGRATEDEALRQANTDNRRAEALFQAGIVAFSSDRAHAEQCWRQVLDHGAPSLIEYGAALNELARLAPSPRQNR